ncbi:WD40-repeat-containing domain protein [Flagelloscypha sp. PMI_526]|nr:WD40-repeat-containing domain protein [Flagelloscypha sp. PMI_526]
MRQKHPPAGLKSFVSAQDGDLYKTPQRNGGLSLIPAYSCGFRPNRSRNPLLAAGLEDGSILLIDTQRKRKRQQSWSIMHCLNCSGMQLATGLRQVLEIKRFKLPAQKQEQSKILLVGHTGTIRCLTWDAQSPQVLSSGSRDGAILRWDLRSGDKLDSEGSLLAVQKIPNAHASSDGKSAGSTPKSVTGVLHLVSSPHLLVSSGSSDGILKSWDTRFVRSKKRLLPAQRSLSDPTTAGPSRRPRGIVSLVHGAGPSAATVFALSSNNTVVTYSAPSLCPTPATYSHPNLQTDCFYLSASLSRCGEWLACSSRGPRGSVFVWDVRTCGRRRPIMNQVAHLEGQVGRTGALSWSDDGLVSCADSGTLRMWRRDEDLYRRCLDDIEASRWNYHWAT